jgi:hypothetical protein
VPAFLSAVSSAAATPSTFPRHAGEKRSGQVASEGEFWNCSRSILAQPLIMH